MINVELLNIKCPKGIPFSECYKLILKNKKTKKRKNTKRKNIKRKNTKKKKRKSKR